MKRELPTLIILLLLASCSNQNSEKKDSKATSEWIKYHTTYFSMHAQKGVRSEKKLKRIGENAESIQENLLSILQENEKQKLEIYLLKDRQTLTSYTGFPARGYTNTEKGIIYFVDADPFHLALKHEIMHALSWRLWGTPIWYWISEGVAVFASGNCGGNNLHSLAHEMNRQGKLVSFAKLNDNFDFKALEPSLQSASIIQFIYDTYGVKVLRSVWEKGWEDLKDITGLSPAELERNWTAHIQQEKYKTKIMWNTIYDSGCE